MYKLPWMISSALVCCSLSFAADTTASPVTSAPVAIAVDTSTSSMPVSSPAGQPSQIEIESFRTYDFEPSAAGSEKHFATTFPNSTTTYIYARMEGKNKLYNDSDATYRFNYRFFDSSGKLMGSYDSDFTIKKDWEYFYFYASWGFADVGQWDAGRHKVEVWIGDTKIAETSFTITPQ